MRNLRQIAQRDQGPKSGAPYSRTARGGSGHVGSPAATACTWRVQRGSMIADAELQDTQPAVPQSATVVQPVEASCALDGDRPTGSVLGIRAYYEQRHVSCMLAGDCDPLRDTQAAVPRPAADAPPTASSRTSSGRRHVRGVFVGGIAGLRSTCFHGISGISRRIEI